MKAYCAPGRREVAALVLDLKGEAPEEIIEHPWLEGDERIILVADMPPLETDPEAFRVIP